MHILQQHNNYYKHVNTYLLTYTSSSLIIYRRMGIKCVAKCLHLRENKLIAFPIIAIAAHPVHVVPVVIIIVCVPMIAIREKLAIRNYYPLANINRPTVFYFLLVYPSLLAS